LPDVSKFALKLFEETGIFVRKGAEVGTGVVATTFGVATVCGGVAGGAEVIVR